MIESDFRAELIRGMNLSGHAVPIPDSGGVMGRKKYDSGYLENGIFHALELKMVKDGFTLPFRRLEAHQEDALMDCFKHGGFGWLAVNFRIQTPSKKAEAQYGKRINRAFMLTVNKFLSIHDYKDGSGGISMEDFIKYSLELEHSQVNKLQSWIIPQRLYRYAEAQNKSDGVLAGHV